VAYFNLLSRYLIGKIEENKFSNVTYGDYSYFLDISSGASHKPEPNTLVQTITLILFGDDLSLN
jgi:hypothetical protein